MKIKALKFIERILSKTVNFIVKLLKKVYDTLLTPMFFLSTILIAFIINSFFTSDVINLPVKIKFLVENRTYSFTLIIVWGIICFLKNDIDEKKNKIKYLNKSLENKERQIEQSSGILEARYGEFADSISKSNIEKILINAVKRFPLVEACHLYSYEFQRINNCVDIKVSFLQGYEQERVCINVVRQNYYSIDKNIFQQLRALKHFNTLKNNKVVEEVSKIYNMVEASNLHISIKYRINEILFYLLCEKLKYDNKGFEKIDDEFSLDSFRTGIVGSILLEKGYIYKYKRNKEEKKGRVYFTTPIVLDSEYVLNIAVDGRDLNRVELGCIFENIVLFIKNEYNKIIGGVKSDKTKN